jgi:dihydroflavonol-4-reductase
MRGFYKIDRTVNRDSGLAGNGNGGEMAKGALLVTGATGLVGSNLCLAALAAGYRVRGLVRSAEGTGPLSRAGVELVVGDVTDAASLAAAARGMENIVHTAAVLGGTWSKATPGDFWSVNYQGVQNVLDAGKTAGVRRTVCYSSIAILDWSRTSSNHSPIAPIGPNDSPYTRAKRAAFYASMHRASMGEDIVTVMPCMIYGPGPLVDRALDPTSFTGTLLAGLRGDFKEYVGMLLSWSYVHDSVAIGLAALERCVNGARYLASGREADTCSLPAACNRANAMAGVAHRVREVDLSAGGNIGSMKTYAERKYAKPFVDPSETEAELGIAPTPLDQGLSATIDWLRQAGKL